MKKYFENPEVSVQKFNAEDVITASGGGSGANVGGGEGLED